jgi:hypothetical protein
MSGKKSLIKCDKNISFVDCEMSILRLAIDKAEENTAKRVVSSPEIKTIVGIVENFIKKKNLICYGGTAINNILPKHDQFYNKELEIPDYDFFSFNALNDAKELADIYLKNGFTDVEAKSGQHHGTYKVFVNFIPIADITYLPKEIFQSIKMESIRVAGILYAPPNYLRMGMFLELSRPDGDTSRWEKVLKRITLLNKHYPLTTKNCDEIDFQREFENKNGDEIYETVKNTLINQEVVFFGGFAVSMYSKYMPKNLQKQLKRIPDFDVLSEDPQTTAEIVKERLKDIDVENVKIVRHDAIGDIIPVSYEIIVDEDTIAFIYTPIACHSYNEIAYKKERLRIATIDTMMSFYLAFLYADKPYYDIDRILCMSKFLFEVQQKNRLEQKGLLKRFSIECYGHQDTVEEMRAEKAKKFAELKNNRGSREFEDWFLVYKPGDSSASKTNAKAETTNTTKTINTTKTAKTSKTAKNKKENSNSNSHAFKSKYFKVIKSKSTPKSTRKKSRKTTKSRKFFFF